MIPFVVFLFVLLLLHNAHSFVVMGSLMKTNGDSNIRLFSHRPQLKAIKKVMHRQPKKTRRSDKIRRNVNLNKCLEQHPDNLAMPDLTPVEPEELEQALREHNEFLIHGSTDDPWIDLDDNTTPVPKHIEYLKLFFGYVAKNSVITPQGLPPDGPKKMPLRRNKAVGAVVQYPKPWL